MAEVFETNGGEFRVLIGTNVVKVFLRPIMLEDVKSIARNCGIKKFTVETLDGTVLSGGDFPVSGDVVLKAYYAAK